MELHSFAELIVSDNAEVIVGVSWKAWLFIQRVKILFWLLGSFPSRCEIRILHSDSLSLPFSHFNSGDERTTLVSFFKTEVQGSSDLLFFHLTVDNRTDTPTFFHKRNYQSLLSYTF